MTLYKAYIDHQLDSIVWEFEAENDNQAQAIVDERARSILVGILSKRLYVVGKRVR